MRLRHHRMSEVQGSEEGDTFGQPCVSHRLAHHPTQDQKSLALALALLTWDHQTVAGPCVDALKSRA